MNIMGILSKLKLIKTYRSDFTVVFVFDMVSKFIGALLTILIIRILSSEEYAIFTKVSSISFLISGILGTGIGLGLVRYTVEMVSRGIHIGYRLYKICILLSTSLAIISSPIIYFLPRLYSFSLYSSFLAFLYGVVLSLVQINQLFLQANEKYSTSGFLSNLRHIIIFFIIVIIICLGFSGSTIVIVVHLASSFLICCIGFVIIRKDDIKREGRELIPIPIVSFKKVMNDTIRVAGWLILYSMFLNLLNQTDIYMISRMLTEKDVSSYGVAYKYYSLMLSALPSIKAVLRVHISKKEYVDNSALQKRYYYSWMKKIWKIALPLSIVAILGSQILFPIINGEEYHTSIITFQILVVGVFISYVFSLNVQMMQVANRNKELCLISIFTLIFNIATNLKFIPALGIKGAAITTVLSHALLQVFCAIVVLKNRI